MSADPSRIGIVILAAGASTRLGKPKQLLSLHGQSLLSHTVRIAVETGDHPIIAVLGAQAEMLRPELDHLPVTIAINADWEEGMASSIRSGIETLIANDAPIEAAILLLCDQPLLTADVLRSLIAAYHTGSYTAITSVYETEAIGPPCLFDRTLFADLLTIRGAQGAKQIFSRLPNDSVGRVVFLGGNCDIDTPGDWERFIDSAIG